MKEAYQKGRGEVANTLFIPLPLRSNQPAPLSPCKEIDKEAAASVVALTLRPPPPSPPSRNHGNDDAGRKTLPPFGPSNERKPTCASLALPRFFPQPPPSRPCQKEKDDKKRKGIKERER
ncbi:hypothetical protein CEXT_80841 [Caerostris extrusa]|uniref:Uncharacterized protein n=1 Tax=Caerostris extrusa TaxID=172846 RepID=A0AAV4M413_CAEEX|nr:hypothetical protein CEXT_80841 [Caerostris extrusa]